MANYLNQKRLIEHDQFDPVKNLWRNVLVVSLEDAIKSKSKFLRFSDFYKDKRSEEIAYVTEPNVDFVKVCELAGLNHNMVRKNINYLFKKMENKEKFNLPWKRLTTCEVSNK